MIPAIASDTAGGVMSDGDGLSIGISRVVVAPGNRSGVATIICPSR